MSTNAKDEKSLLAVVAEQICNTCRSMTTTARGLASLFDDEGFTYGRGEVFNNAAEGCMFCKLLLQAVSSPRELSEELISCRISLREKINKYSETPGFEIEFWKQYSLIQDSAFGPWLGVYLMELDRRSGGHFDIYGFEGDYIFTS